MAKPRLVKVRALFYVLQQVMKRGCIGILIHPLKKSIHKGLREEADLSPSRMAIAPIKKANYC